MFKVATDRWTALLMGIPQDYRDRKVRLVARKLPPRFPPRRPLPPPEPETRFLPYVRLPSPVNRTFTHQRILP